MESSLKPYIVLVDPDRDYLVAAHDFIETNLPGFTVFMASDGVEAIHTMHMLDRPAIFMVSYDLPDLMNGLELILRNIGQTFRFPSFSYIVTDNDKAKVVDKVFRSGIIRLPKTHAMCQELKKRELCEGKYSLDIFYKGHILYAVSQMKVLSVDPLTKALTPDGGLERWEKDFARALRHKTPTACIFVDVNFLKEINDTYGHSAGNKLLVAVADSLKVHVRNVFDYVIRYGGDEFLVILPETTKKKARKISERILSHIEELTVGISDKVTIKPSVAVGVADLWPTSLGRDPKEAFEKLFEDADEAMYKNKLAYYRRTAAMGDVFAKEKLVYYQKKIASRKQLAVA